MLLINKVLHSFLLAFLVVFTTAAYAGEMKTTQGYLIHYNALNTELIPPEVARHYQITRSKSRALLTVVVLKPSSEKELLPKSVLAQVTAQAVNLNQQLKTIDMQRIQEGEAIYYTGVFSVTNEEILDFTIKVQPENQSKPEEITFRQQFFVN